MIFPTVSAETHQGKSLVLPADLDGTYNALVIAFQKYQQHDVKTWLPTLGALYAQNDSFNYYLLPTIQGLPGWQEEFIDIRAAMRQRRSAHLLTLYVDLNDFNRALDIPTVSQIYVLLLNRAGKILWRSQGAYSPAKADGLSAAVRKKPVRHLTPLPFLR